MSKDTEAQSHLESGNAFYEERKYSEACEEYQKAIEIDPNYVDAYYRWGLALANLNKYEEAIEKYKKTIEIDPNYVDAYNDWGNALYNLKRYDETVEKYLKAIEIDPNSFFNYDNWINALDKVYKDLREKAIERFQKAMEGNADAYNYWGLALANLEKHEEAIEKYKKAIEIKNDHVYAQYNMGLALDRLGKYEDAIHQYKKAIEILKKNEEIFGKSELETKYTDAYSRWGLALFNLKKYNEAVEKYLKAIEINPDSIDYANWNDALDKLTKDERDKAIVKFHKAIESKPADIGAGAYYNWGNVLYNLTRYEEAIEKYRKAIEIDPNYVDAYNDWGNALYNLKRYDEAIEKYQKVIEIDPGSVYYANWNDALDKLTKDERDRAIERFHMTIESKTADIGASAYNDWGNILCNLKRYEEAIEEYKKAIEIKHDYVYGHYNWGLALANLKKYEEAIEEYKKAIEIDPSYVDAYNYWGNALSALKKYEEAIEKYKKTIEIKHDYAYGYYNWGLALANLKKYEEALEKYKKAVEIKYDYVHAHHNWGLALASLGKSEDAIKKYKEAIEIDPKDVSLYFDWGIALDDLKRYEDAIEKYKEIIQIDPDSIDAIFAFHNIADILWRQGKYAASRKEWERVSEYYEKEESKKKAKESQNADYFLYFGSIPHEIFREFDRAEEIYREGLELDQNHVLILIKIVSLYLEMMDENVNEQTPAYGNAFFVGTKKERLNREEQTRTYWKAREAYNKAESIIKNQLSTKAEDADTLLQLGDLHLAMEEYDKAEKCLMKALGKDEELATAYTNLGIIYSRNQDNLDYKKAVKYFKKAYNLKYREDLTIQSNLAEAYLKAGDPNMAEIEYKKILSITPFHVESHIGLGEVYSELGTDGDEDAYDKAIYHFTEGINIAENKKNKKGSKILTRKELAAVLYSRGYTRVKLYEVSKTMKDESLLHDALEDFKNCFRNDPYNHKAKRAKEKIEKRFKDLSPHRRPEVFGPLAIFFSSLIVFISSQSSFFIGKPFIIYGNLAKPLDIGYYVLLTFSSILFMIAGLYLPQILKLKVGGIELEKSTVEQITTPSTIGISK